MNILTLPAKLTTCAITLLCATSMLCSAQSPYRPVPNQTWNKTVALDTAFMRVSYEMTFRDALFYSTSEPGGLEDHVFAEKEILSDTRIVEFGDRVRKDYSQILEAREMLNREMTERGEMPRNLGSSSVYPIELFVFSDSYRINRRTLLTGPILQYEGGCTPMQWSLTGEAEQVGDYQCQKAVTSFGGREWTAWFCPDIPVDGGRKAFLMDHDRHRERLVAHLREAVPLPEMQSQGSRKDSEGHVPPSFCIPEERGHQDSSA